MTTPLWQRRIRRGSNPAWQRREFIEVARAIAFQDMYRNYGDTSLRHHLTSEDIQDVWNATRPRVVEYMQKDHLVWEWEWTEFDRTITAGVEQAAAAFRSI